MTEDQLAVLRRLTDEKRQYANDVALSAITYGSGFDTAEAVTHQREAERLTADADALDAALAQETRSCEGCEWAGQPDSGVRECFSTLHGTRPVGISIYVPLTLNGRPFKCDGGQAKNQEETP